MTAHATRTEDLLGAADAARAAGDTAAAEGLYARALTQEPGRADASLGLALSVFARDGDLDAAARAVRRCVLLDTGYPDSWVALGHLRLAADDPAGAASAFAAALALRPDNATLAIRRAEAAVAAGHAHILADTLALACAAEPGRVSHAVGLAVVLERTGAVDAAIDAMEASALLNPGEALPRAALGNMLARANRLRAALPHLREALALDPSRDDTQSDLAAVLMRMHRPAEAMAILHRLDAARAADGRPMDPGHLCNLAIATSNVGDQDGAVAAARRAIAVAPEDPQGYRAVCNTLPYTEAASGAGLLEAARVCAGRLARPPVPQPAIAGRVGGAGARLRVGLLSGSLREHPVGWLTLAGLEALPRDGFDLIAFAQADADDPVSRRFHAACGAWHGTAGQPDAHVAATIRAAGVDILLDLGGYGEAGRMAVCARRAAPVQIKWVGMQNATTGIAEMDWFITDRWQTPPGQEAFYTERLLTMPDGYVCYAPPADAPAVAPAPAAAAGHVTFGCFNTLAKLTGAVIGTWAEILRAVPDSRLVLKTQTLDDPAAHAFTLARFVAAGVDEGRLTLLGGTPHRRHLAAYAQVDMLLDPFPYAGGLTTCEALWMGVPTLTLPGTSFASRHSASHLSNVGLADWIAPDRGAYVAQAVARSAGPAALTALAALRASMRDRVAASPLVDARRFGANLAQALRRAWAETARPDIAHAARPAPSLNGRTGLRTGDGPAGTGTGDGAGDCTERDWAGSDGTDGDGTGYDGTGGEWAGGDGTGYDGAGGNGAGGDGVLVG